MMRKFLVIAVAGACLTAVPAAAGAVQTSAAPQAQGEDDPDRVICRRESSVGSRVQRRRVCMTQRELLKRENGTRDRMGTYIREATSGAPR